MRLHEIRHTWVKHHPLALEVFADCQAINTLSMGCWVHCRYTRLHELGVAQLVQKHEQAGADGSGIDAATAAAAAADRSVMLSQNLLQTQPPCLLVKPQFVWFL